MSVDVFLDGVPARQRSAALFDQLRTAIATGRLAPGDRLPTSRDLATQLGVARSTIATVYARLIGEGYAQGRTGDGTYVTSYPAATPATASTGPPDPPRRTRAATRPAPTLDPPLRGWAVDLRSGQPDPTLFPLTDWRRSVTGVMHSPPPGYGHAAGLPELRRAIAAWISRSRGVHATADHVLVTAGAQGAFDLCARTLINRDDTVAVENPGYPPARHAFAHHGARLAAVPVDHDGIDIDHIPRHAAAIIVTPSHQSPTGALLSASRRRHLIELATAIDAVVIEDDYDTEYRYVDRPLEPLHRLDPSGRVIYVGTFSKTLAPSLRLGFLVAAPAFVETLADARRSVDAQPPHLTQAALASFLTSGAFDRHLRRTRRIYRSRRDHLTALLDELVADHLITAHVPCHAGLHTTITTPPHVDPVAIARQLQHRSIAITTTSEDRLDQGPAAIVIGFGLADNSQLTVAVSALRRALTDR